MYKHLFMHQRP